MKTLLALAGKDLRRRLAEPIGLLFNLSIPLVIAGTMAMAFGGRSGSESPVLRLVLVDLDEGPLSQFLAGGSQNSEAAERMQVVRATTREEGLEKLHDEEAAALVVIPKGFSRTLLSGERATFEVLKNPSQTVMPQVAEKGAEVLSLYAAVLRRLVDEDLPRLKGLVDGDGWDDAAGLALALIRMKGRVDAADDVLFPPLIEIGEPVKRDAAPGRSFNIMAWMYPGLMVMGLMYTGLLQMRDLLRERDAGTLRRQLCSPVGAAHVLGSKIVSVAMMVALSLIIMMAIGTAAFGMRWGAPTVLVPLSAAVVLAITGFCAMLFALVSTERQGDAVGGIVVMLMSMVGGAFIPPQVMPPFLRSAQAGTLNHWAHDALRTVSFGGGWDKVATHMLVLTTMGLLFVGAGLLLLHRRHMRGHA
ncbi:MAG: ABC transporter permease [Candidatus Polarisedimenticolia bacterium]